MRTEKEIEAVVRDAFEHPAPMLDDAALMAQYGDLIRLMGEEIRAAFAHPRSLDLVVAAVTRAGRKVFELVERAADVVATVAGGGAEWEPAYATRSMGGGGRTMEGGGAARLVAEKTPEEETARLRLTLESAGDRQNLRVEMVDAGGRRLSPMTLTVVDGESGKTLLDAVRYGSGEVVLRGVEPGEYDFVAESGEATADFALKLR